MKYRYIELMIGWAIAVCIIGSALARGAAAFTGADPSESIRFWFSLWWAWLPVGLLIGFQVGRSST